MCGIWGRFSADGLAAQERDVRAVFSRLAHRGPDAMRFEQSGPAAFAHARLSIIDLSDGNSQPFVTERCMVVFNGEIYNYRDLRGQLMAQGVHFRSEGDTEVIARGYEVWGRGIFDRLLGMYAIGLFDRRDNRLLLARDRFGIKPLYWVSDTVEVVFSSEIKGLAEEMRFDFNPNALADLMTFGYYFESGPVFEGVECVGAGEIIEFGVAGERLISVRQASRWSAAAPTRADASSVREVLRDSVTAHLIADVPVATALSGGIDSSIVTALAARAHPQVLAITNTWQGEDDIETEYAAQLTNALGIRHHLYKTEVVDGKELLRRLVWHLEDPIPNVAAFHSYLIGEVCRDAGIKVVLLGEGADELFAGYPWHRLALRAAESNSPAEMFDLYESRRSQRATMQRYLTPDGAALLTRRAQHQRELFEEFVCSHSTSRLEAFLAFERRGQLQVSQLQRVDRMYMAHGVEARVPYLYDPVVAVAERLPEHEKIADDWWRRVLRLRRDKVVLAAAFAGDVPHAILHRPKFGRRGSANLADHLTGTLEVAMDEVLSAPDHQSGRASLSALVDWRVVNQSPLPFKIKLLLALMTLCAEIFGSGDSYATTSPGRSPVRRVRLSTTRRSLPGRNAAPRPVS